MKKIVYTEIVPDVTTQETRIVVAETEDGFAWYIDGVTSDGLAFETDDDYAESIEEAVAAAKEYLRFRSEAAREV